ncbi:MAG: hypothetical protein A2Y50_11565 [Pseudomonadales bacterium RIFCSPLOWO2_12_59_9]|nr:MAG: hypothetical protein A2Y50_11565 [Pseudomonadales bacterium RIFCSPLOWO2_12_59_9]
MKADYDSGGTVRRARLFGWVVCGLIALGLVWAMGSKILRVSEARALDATRENLLASLTVLAAERVVQGQVADTSWLRRNPFQLLRWESSDYCGELQELQLPQAGCWHYLPARGWLLHRSRFTDSEQGIVAELRVFQLQAVPKAPPGSTESQDAVISLELNQVPAADVTALADTYQ